MNSAKSKNPKTQKLKPQQIFKQLKELSEDFMQNGRKQPPTQKENHYKKDAPKQLIWPIGQKNPQRSPREPRAPCERKKRP